MTTLRTDSTHSGITIDYADGSGFVHGGSGPLTVYSDDEKAAINALTDANDDTYYLFLVKNVTKLDADGNRTIVSGYMPVGYQHGFIFEQFDVARTIAHELSHGAFALHHTFSANTESFHANEGTTNNLMDYTEHGTTLNHKQWRWMHEKHGKGLFGFLADESEGESLLNQDAILSYLKLIHDANVKNQKQLAIPKTDVYYEGKDIQLGDVGKLSFIRIGDITNGKKEEQPLILFYGYNNIFIKPNEISETEIMKDDVKYTKYTFHLAEGVKIPTTEPELTETVALEIMVKSSEKDILKDFLFTNWEYLMTKERLTAAQIAIARDGISKVLDEKVRGDLFQSLQEKVQYHSQRDNEYEKEYTCNQTSLAMAFEMLGVSKRDFIKAIEENEINGKKVVLTDEQKELDFEDVLDAIRNNANLGNRTACATWEKLADIVGIKHRQIWVESSKKSNAQIARINDSLRNGCGIVVSLFNYKGHIVRLQNIDDEKGMTIDDPYGCLTNLAVRDLGNTKYSEYGRGYKDHVNGVNINNDGSIWGENNTLTWDDFDISVATSRSGEIESESQDKFKVSSTDKDNTKFCDWWNGPIGGKSEYSIREETIEKKDKDGNVMIDDKGNIIYEKKTYYKSKGAVIKMYMIFTK